MYIGEIFLEFVNMLPAFQTYCLQQSTSVNMLNTLEKEKELLRYRSCRGNVVPSLPWLCRVIRNGKDSGVITYSEEVLFSELSCDDSYF